MKSKNLVITTISIIFLAIASAPLSSQEGSSYDPWIDYNDDGDIDVNDLHELAAKYGTSGKPINKTELLLNLQSRIEALEAKVQTLEINAVSSKFLYSDSAYFDLAKNWEQGSTEWVTAKTVTIPSNSLLNSTIIIYFNLVSYCYIDDAWTAHLRITVSGIERLYWPWVPQYNNPPASYLPMDTRLEAVKLNNIDNSAEVIINLDFKIDRTVSQNGPSAYARISNYEFIVMG